MLDKAIKVLIEKEVKKAVIAHHEKIIDSLKNDHHNVRRFSAHEYVKLYCKPNFEDI